MHEQSLVAELLDAIDLLRLGNPRLRDLTATAAVRVEVHLGQLSGVEPMLLQSAFDMQAPARLGPRWSLALEHVATRAACDACGDEFSPLAWNFFCPACGSGDTRILQGDRLVLRRLTWSHEP